MRVLIIFNHPAPYKVNVFNELSKLIDLTVIFERTKESDRPDSFYGNQKYEFEAITLKDGYIGKWGSISNNVRKYIKNQYHEYDYILMNGYSHLAEIKAIRYMAKHKIKFGLLINGGIIKSKECSLKKNYKTSIVNKASYYLSPSQKSNEYLEYYGADPSKIHNYCYSNFFYKDITSPSKNEKLEARKKFGLPLEGKIFINPSQFIERKNNLYLISLFKDRKDTLVLVGDGPLKSKYEEYIAEHKMTNVFILPFLKKEDLFYLYKACDIHITLSKEDIFGHTVLEAFANGLPVISSNKVISALEYVKDGYNGYLVDLNNEKQIKEALEKCDNSLSDNAIKSAQKNTFENSALSIYQILKDLHE